MSERAQKENARRRAETKARSLLFFALGDETRLALIGKLSSGTPQSIARLTQGSQVTRQAVTKHLHVLEEAGLVQSIRAGRESLFQFRPDPLKEAQSYLEQVSAQWEDALERLKSFVEN